MDESERKYLTGSIMLSRYEDGSSPQEYSIRSVIGEGVLTVCYEATRMLKDGTTETGILKEFYPFASVVNKPIWPYLERLSNGRLVSSADTVHKFDQMCKDYLSTYKMLRKTIENNPKNEIPRAYIRHEEVLYTCINQENEADTLDEADLRRPTVYIWSPEFPGKSFDLYLAEIRNNPARKPEKRLQDILSVIDALIDYINAFHTAGLMHMDIRPSNFLIQYDNDFETKPSDIALFDINNLCSVKSEDLKMLVTEGFSAPEVTMGEANKRSDIYSIGAMLFNALVITKDIPDGLYRDFHYSSINLLVKHSALFQASETNSDVALMSVLCKILGKCLAKDAKNRYQTCAELKSDLDKTRQRLAKILCTSIEKNTEDLSEPVVVIQKLLYEHPLYETLSKQAKDINVLVIGSGTYGQKFIDVCLQAGQMSGVNLHIFAFSDEPEEDKTAYLRFRPAIAEFVNINGSMAGRESLSYASVDFRGVAEIKSYNCQGIRFTEKMSQLNQEIIQSLILQSMETQKEYSYVFVSLGDDALSESIARTFSREINHACPVCYVSQTKVTSSKADIEKRLYPVCVSESLDATLIEQRLGEMAFNTHISWNDTLNFDVLNERKKFFAGETEIDKYNRTASFAFALSLKYKLHSVQIDCHDPLEAAQMFSKQVLEARFTDPEAKAKFDRLVDLEHRRWLIERATDGWSSPRNTKGKLLIEDCVTRGSVKDPVNRTHLCMVRGSETSPLSDPKYSDSDHRLWNVGAIDSKLDELDRMSIELHRCFRKHADKLRKDDIYQNDNLLFIQDQIPAECEETMRAFKQFRFALKNIINGVESYSRQYGHYQDVFKKSLSPLPDEIRVEIERRLTAIEHDFFPVIESNLYHNYKANDEILIKKIPFILTYRYASAIAIAFEDGKYQNGRNEAVFTNVAAATVLSPEVIKYFYCFNGSSNVALLIQKLDAILNYFKKRNTRTSIEVVIACFREVPDKERKRLQSRLTELRKNHTEANGNAWFAKDTIYDVENNTEATLKFIEYLKESPIDLYDGDNQLFSSVYDNAMFIRQITELNIPYFEFDWRKKEFSKRINCEYLQYVKDASFIRIRDMFALMNASDIKYKLPAFVDDFEALWKIYTGQYLKPQNFESGIANWIRLCICLRGHDANHRVLANMAVQTSTSDPSSYKTVTYHLPEFCLSTVEMVVQKLQEYGIAARGSNITAHSSDTYKLELRINANHEQSLNKVFSDPHILMPYYGIEVLKEVNSNDVKIRCNNPVVTDVNLDRGKSNQNIEPVFGVLRQLEKGQFIRKLKRNAENPKLVSFVYSSPQIKKLLTNEGEILEVYAYYDVLKTGYFDDVVSAYKLNWEFGSVDNELDLVLTKGFRSIIVECKAGNNLTHDFYYKLHSIADQFGIGTIKVLLGDTHTRSDTARNEKNRARSRGIQMHIRTISNKDEIINIGKTLKKLMEESW